MPPADQHAGNGISQTAVGIRDFVKEVAETSRGLSTRTIHRLKRWCVLLACCLQNRCESVVIGASAAEEPVLCAYQSDGWSSLVRARTTFDLEETQVVRNSRCKKEFLLERAIYKTIDANGVIFPV